jgi:seryl-tRNA(Sec) selenium transferase
MCQDMLRRGALRGIAACDKTLELYRKTNKSDAELKEVSLLRQMTKKLSSLFESILHVIELKAITFTYGKKSTRDLVSCNSGIVKLEKALAGLQRAIDPKVLFELKTIEKLRHLLCDLHLDLGLAIRVLQSLVVPFRQSMIVE